MWWQCGGEAPWRSEVQCCLSPATSSWCRHLPGPSAWGTLDPPGWVSWSFQHNFNYLSKADLDHGKTHISDASNSEHAGCSHRTHSSFYLLMQGRIHLVTHLVGHVQEEVRYQSISQTSVRQMGKLPWNLSLWMKERGNATAHTILSKEVLIWDPSSKLLHFFYIAYRWLMGWLEQYLSRGTPCTNPASEWYIAPQFWI